ncbi:MAG: hypothetical protein V1744_06255 [Candidatus Altiarchaeota archaeon]
MAHSAYEGNKHILDSENQEKIHRGLDNELHNLLDRQVADKLFGDSPNSLTHHTRLMEVSPPDSLAPGGRTQFVPRILGAAQPQKPTDGLTPGEKATFVQPQQAEIQRDAKFVTKILPSTFEEALKDSTIIPPRMFTKDRKAGIKPTE